MSPTACRLQLSLDLLRCAVSTPNYAILSDNMKFSCTKLVSVSILSEVMLSYTKGLFTHNITLTLPVEV